MEPSLKTPTEWLELLGPGWGILDPDGWRLPNSPPFEQPITEEEFNWRFGRSTIKFPPNPVGLDKALSDL